MSSEEADRIIREHIGSSISTMRDAIEAALLAAHRRGEDSMRERAAKVADDKSERWTDDDESWDDAAEEIAAAIRALPGDAT